MNHLRLKYERKIIVAFFQVTNCLRSHSDALKSRLSIDNLQYHAYVASYQTDAQKLPRKNVKESKTDQKW